MTGAHFCPQAMQHLQKLKSERGGKPETEVLEGESTPSSVITTQSMNMNTNNWVS